MLRRSARPHLVAALVAVLLAAGKVVHAEPGPDGAALAWPLAIDPALTSTFGEHRFGYFHSGIDLTTWGETGVPLVAPGDGYVYRVRASGVGYGRALYMRLDSGPVVLFGHLGAFVPEVAAFVRAEQERLGRYEVDLYPTDARFRVTRGEVVAYSGESGAGPPHLHLETRNRAGDVALNPLPLLDSPLADTRRPTMISVSVAPASPYTLVDGSPFAAVLSLSETGDGTYVADTSEVTGPVALSVHVFDKADGKEQRLAVYGLELRVDGELHYASHLDSVPYAQQREVDLVYDAGRVAEGQRRVRRLYRPRGSHINVHGGGSGRIAPAVPGGARTVEILASDWFGNTSTATFVLRTAGGAAGSDAADTLVAGESPADEAPMDRPPSFEGDLVLGVDHSVVEVFAPELISSVDTARVAATSGDVVATVLKIGEARAAVRFDPRSLAGPLELTLQGRGRDGRPFESRLALPIHAVGPDTGSTLSAPGARLEVGAGAVFSPECLLLERVAALDVRSEGLTRVSDVYRVGPNGLVLEGSVRLSIVPTDTLGLEHVGVYVRHPRRPVWIYLGGALAGTEIGAEIRGTGRFCLVRDDAVPMIRSIRPRDGARIADATPTLRARLGDIGSGLSWRGLVLELDGRALIAEWDPEAGELRGPVPSALAKGEHVVRVRVTDQAGNTTERQTSFTVIDE